MSEEQTRENRNQVFSGGQQGIPTRNVMEQDFGISIPVESVPLPSMGIVYEAESPLYGQELVDVKAMTAREEDILTSRALIKKGTVITELIRSCMVDKSVNPDDLLSGDRNALMIAIRVTGYGSEYSVEVECPACDEKSKQDFQLADLAIKRLGIQPVAEGSNVFEYVLPLTKKTVRFKFLTGRDEQEMSTIAERRKKQGATTDSSVTQRLMHQLISVGGISDKNKINQFIRHMPAGDSLALRRYVDKNEPGLDMKTWMSCPHCSEESEVRLPMGASFFWPDTE